MLSLFEYVPDLTSFLGKLGIKFGIWKERKRRKTL